MRQAAETLILQMYDAVLDPALWSLVLERLRVELNASCGLQHVWRTVNNPEISLCVNADPAEMKRYQEYYYKLDPWMARIHTMPDQTVALTENFLSEHEYRKSEFCNDFLLPQGFYRFVTALDETPPTGVSCLSFLRSRNAPEFSSQEQALLQQLLPHFRICLRIQRRLSSFQAKIDYLETALDALSFGVVLVDSHNRVVHSNASAETLLRKQNELTITAAKLRLKDAGLDRRLQQLLAEANGMNSTLMQRRAGALTFLRSVGERISVIVAPFLARPAQLYQSVSTIVFLIEKNARELNSEQFLQHIFALTPQEARCALLSARGHSIEEISAILGISRNTVRSHLRSLFLKTSTKRQGALVAVINRELAGFDALAMQLREKFSD